MIHRSWIQDYLSLDLGFMHLPVNFRTLAKGKRLNVRWWKITGFEPGREDAENVRRFFKTQLE